jgi:hypothetical protein
MHSPSRLLAPVESVEGTAVVAGAAGREEAVAVGVGLLPGVREPWPA